ncbi:MAG: 4-(cytidine 5'-diphospho)-2-C-methyl-D-erythritol kinase [Acidiferrobacterales bacterium]
MTGKTTRWPAPAKLNLFLHVTGQRDDGYHTLQTVFQFVDWCDWLTFEINQTGEISRTGNLKLADNDDLCLSAARLLQQTSQTGLGVTIHLEKNLPVGGGLGGGSSDAATTLLALNKLWQLAYSPDQLARLGLELGADVPVFIHGQSAFAQGVGELLEPVQLELPWFVIAVPPVVVSTRAIFSDPQLTRSSPTITIRDLNESLSAADNKLGNDLELIVRRRHPEVDGAMKWLSQFGRVRMTGSGACVFLPVANRDKAEEIAGLCPPEMVCHIARGLNEHPARRELLL